MKTIDITWRNEDYGRFSGAASALRWAPRHDGGFLSDSQAARVRGAIKRAGYSYEDARGAYLTYSLDGRAKLIEALERLGFTLHHAGCWAPERGK